MADTTRDFLDLTPLFPNDDEETIRARWDEWANEGVEQDDQDNWTDTREGSMFQICTEPGVRESAKSYDRMGTEVIAAALPMYSWGTYLDDHGTVRNLTRLAPVPATGEVTFTGDNGTVIPIGTRVGAVALDPTSAPPSFQTTAAGTIESGSVTLPVRAAEAGEMGNLSAGALIVPETPVGGVASVTNTDPTIGGEEEETDEAFATRILAVFQDFGTANAATYESWARAANGVGRATIVPLFNGPGTVLVILMTKEGGPVSQDVVDALQLRLDPPRARTTLAGSTDLPVANLNVASTDGFRAASPGAPMFVRIKDELVQYTGADADTFTGASGGTDVYPGGTDVVQGGRGGGLAPVGHHVVVRTAAALLIDVVAQIELKSGFSLDGFGGSVAVKADILAAIAAYISTVEPGDEVVLAQVKGRIATVDGVHDVGTVTLNGGSVNIPVTAVPAQVPVLDDLTLTEAAL